MGPCLLIKSDRREFVKAEGSAHRHNAGDAGAPGAEAEFASQRAALGRAAGLELILHPNPHCPRPCLYKRQAKGGKGRREEGRKDGSGRAGAGEKQPLVRFPWLSAEKQLMGWEVSTLPGRSLFLPFRVPPAFLLQRLGSCDCSTPLTPRLLWKPMNCLRKVSWQPLPPFSCLPSPDGLGQCRSPLCRQRPTVTSSFCSLTCFFTHSLSFPCPLLASFLLTEYFLSLLIKISSL